MPNPNVALGAVLIKFRGGPQLGIRRVITIGLIMVDQLTYLDNKLPVHVHE